MNDRETRPFFEAAAQGRLIFRACNACGRGLHPPTEHCGFCGSWNTEWREASGEGRLFAWTTTYHQTHAEFPTPYTVAIVELVENSDVRLAGFLPGEPALALGSEMTVWFQKLAPGVVVPQWRRKHEA